MRTIGSDPLLAVASNKQLDHNSSGACGAQLCHASTMATARLHGQLSVNNVSTSTGCTRKVNEVTTPKLPPLPPRSAQKRSALWLASQVSTRPSASTTWAARRLSQVKPYLRPSTPIPPPSVRPAIPTVGQEPAGSTIPYCASPS